MNTIIQDKEAVEELIKAFVAFAPKEWKLNEDTLVYNIDSSGDGYSAMSFSGLKFSVNEALQEKGAYNQAKVKAGGHPTAIYLIFNSDVNKAGVGDGLKPDVARTYNISLEIQGKRYRQRSNIPSRLLKIYLYSRTIEGAINQFAEKLPPILDYIKIQGIEIDGVEKNDWEEFENGGVIKLSGEDEMSLYDIWGEKDLYEQNRVEALALAKDKFPLVDNETLDILFTQFLDDTDDSYVDDDDDDDYGKGGAVGAIKQPVAKDTFLYASTGVKVKVLDYDSRFGGRVLIERADGYETGGRPIWRPLKKFSEKPNKFTPTESAVDAPFSIYGSGGEWYIKDAKNHHTVPSSTTQYWVESLNKFKTKADAVQALQIMVDKMHEENPAYNLKWRVEKDGTLVPKYGRGGEVNTWHTGWGDKVGIKQLSFSKVDYDVNVKLDNMEVDVNIKANDSVDGHALADTDAEWDSHHWGYMVYPKTKEQLFAVLRALKVRFSEDRVESALSGKKYEDGGVLDVDTLHPLDLWVKFPDNRYYRKFQFQQSDMASGKYRVVVDNGVSEKMVDNGNYWDVTISVASESEADRISEIFMKEFPIEYGKGGFVKPKAKPISEWSDDKVEKIYGYLSDKKGLAINEKRDYLKKMENDYKLKFAQGGSVKSSNFIKINTGGKYLTVETLEYEEGNPNKNGNLKLTLTPEGREELVEGSSNNKSDAEIMSELFESIQANSELLYFDDAGEVGLGMTSAPAITDGYWYDDDGKLTDEGHPDAQVFWYPNYMVRSFIDDLLENGYAIFVRADSYEKGGALFSNEDIFISGEETEKGGSVFGGWVGSKDNANVIIPFSYDNKADAMKRGEEIVAALNSGSYKSGIPVFGKGGSVFSNLDLEANDLLEKELNKHSLIGKINVRNKEVIITLNKGYQAYDSFSLKNKKEEIKADALNIIKGITNEPYSVIIVEEYAKGGVVSGFSLTYEAWGEDSTIDKNGKLIVGTIRTIPENYYVASVFSDGTVLNSGIESNTRHIDSAVIQEWYSKNVPKLDKAELLAAINKRLERQYDGSELQRQLSNISQKLSKDIFENGGALVGNGNKSFFWWW